MPLFLDAFLLALASSTDNFMVGLSVGIANQKLTFGANSLISICNAAGAFVASFGGSALGGSLPPHLPPLLSAIAFGFLALREFWEFWQTVRSRRTLLFKNKEKRQSEETILKYSDRYENDNDSKPISVKSTTTGKNLNLTRAFHLAIPMTLNNLAGGVAGGAIGISPFLAGLYGLLASFLTMALGHLIGHYFARFSSKQTSRTSNVIEKESFFFNQFLILLDPSFASGSLLGILSLMSLQEVIST